MLARPLLTEQGRACRRATGEQLDRGALVGRRGSRRRAQRQRVGLRGRPEAPRQTNCGGAGALRTRTMCRRRDRRGGGGSGRDEERDRTPRGVDDAPTSINGKAERASESRRGENCGARLTNRWVAIRVPTVDPPPLPRECAGGASHPRKIEPFHREKDEKAAGPRPS